MADAELEEVEGSEESEEESYVDLALADGVESEKCVVSQFRTSLAQKEKFQALVDKSDRTKVRKILLVFFQ